MLNKQAVVADFESTMSGYVHTICLIPFKFNQNVTTQKGVLLCIKDVIKKDIIQENPDVRKKIASSVIDVANYDLHIKYMNFYEAIEYMIYFIATHGGILINHNMLADLDFLSKTQDLVGGKRIIKKKLKEYPDSGMYDKRWSSITKICSMCLINNRCHKFNEHYHEFHKKHELQITSGGYYSTRLETFTQFIRNDPTYNQTHSAVQDTMDLVNILKSVIKFDGNSIIEKSNYLVKPEWFRVMA